VELRRAAKRDANERGIIDALERAGCQVWQLSQRGLPDLLVVRAGVIYLLEVKDEIHGRLTPAQKDNLQRGLPFSVVTHPHEALYAAGLRR